MQKFLRDMNTSIGFSKKSMDELSRSQTTEHKSAQHFPIQILLDNVRSMNNVGSIFRTADATNVAAICLCGLTPVPPHRDIQKTALGATESVSWRHESDITSAIQKLKQDGYFIIGVEQVHNSTSLPDFDFSVPSKQAFIFGNEVMGVSDEALALCDACIEIPQYGAKHSFNIAVSVGIVLWECIRDKKSS